MAESAALLVDEVLPHEPTAAPALAAFVHVTSVGAQRAFPAALSICQPTQNHGQGTGHQSRRSNASLHDYRKSAFGRKQTSALCVGCVISRSAVRARPQPPYTTLE